MSETWNAEMRAYDDCELCGGEGERWLESDHDEIPSPGWVPCDVCHLRRIAELEAALRPFAEAIVYLPDDIADARTLWAEVALGNHLCLMVATARDIRNAAKALRWLEGEAATNESHSDSATQK